MHRSGTSMLANLLADAGLFLGHKVQAGHQEAKFFQELNIYVLETSSAEWDRPEGVATMLADPKARAYLVDYLTTSMHGPRIIDYLGPRRFLRTQSLREFDQPWGWKDPRTTVTFPLWNEVFPHARVIHVTRHGVDVARSLQVRYQSSIDSYIAQFERRRRLYHVLSRRHHFSTSLRMADLDQGMELWDLYVTAAREAVDQLGPRAIEFRYEDFLADPDPVMRRLLEFCEIPVAADRSWAGEVEAGRAYAYRSDPELVELAERHAEQLHRHGYDG